MLTAARSACHFFRAIYQSTPSHADHEIQHQSIESRIESGTLDHGKHTHSFCWHPEERESKYETSRHSEKHRTGSHSLPVDPDHERRGQLDQHVEFHSQ